MKRTPKQIAKAEGISASTVYSLVKQRRLAAIRIGCRGKGKILIEDEAWQAFVESCRTSEQPPDDGELVFLK